MDLISDDTRLLMLKSLGAEEFGTGETQYLWAVLEGEYNEPELTGIPVEGEIRWLECRLSDKDAHNLVKSSRLTRVKNGEEFFVKKFEPSSSSGFLVIRLNR